MVTLFTVTWITANSATSIMSEGIHWKSISRFESYDFVANWYRKAHARRASSTKITQVNACFAQGREYFRNAHPAAMSVKPLLLYYGVLSCCRGVILANDPQKKEESLKHRHGLEVVDWKKTLSGGIREVLELQIRATDGTFCELVDVCWHLNTMHLFAGPTNEIVSNGQRLGDVRFATDRSLLTLGDLISRLKQTGMEYPRLTDRPAKMFGGARVASYPPGVQIAFPLVGIPEELRKLEDGRNILIGSSNQIVPWFRQSDDAGDCLVFVRRENDAHYKQIPVSHYGSGDFMTTLLDFPNGDKLTEFIKIYLVSYVLGMLARYHPSMWIALLRNEKGDFAQPLLVDAVEAIENDFAQELSKQLTGTVRKVPRRMSRR